MKSPVWPVSRAHVSIGAFCYRAGIIFHLAFEILHVPFVGWRRSKSKARWVLLGCVLLTCLSAAVRAQQTNPVDRKVENPITDTPNVNPLQQDQPVRLRSSSKLPTIQPGDVLEVTANKKTVSGTKGAYVEVDEGK